MTKRAVELEIKLIKDQLTLAQRYKEDFRKKLGIVGYDDFINERLERLKNLLDLIKKFQ